MHEPKHITVQWELVHVTVEPSPTVRSHWSTLVQVAMQLAPHCDEHIPELVQVRLQFDSHSCVQSLDEQVQPEPEQAQPVPVHIGGP